ncbi:MAG: DEAD/DEAH box helicase [Stellaceae bacterium]
MDLPPPAKMTNLPVSASDRPSASFDLLSEPVRRWIWQQGWDELHDIQERSIPILLEGRSDVIIAAPTAAGKTEAAFLPLISRIAGCNGRGFKILYLCPLKTLINDQFRRLDQLCEAVELPIHRWHGDIPAAAKIRARKSPAGIVLMTPESLEALLVRRGSEIASLFASVQAIVIDELHAFFGNERGMQLQSLLHRLELAVARRVARIGLSATLGNPKIAAEFLRPRHGDAVAVLESQGNRQTVLLQLRGYQSEDRLRTERPAGPDDADDAGGGCHSTIAHHMHEHLRGRHNLVFAQSRGDVELYADLLRRQSEAMGVPNEFFPHHANLSRAEREGLETRMRDGTPPTTAICTSTLELGIDIGELESVVQIGAPFSVASLRQRLGRSGRRAGRPAAMRFYITERAWRYDLHPVDVLRCELVQAVAMVRLLVAGWHEEPRLGGLHLSTLVHQILAIIAQSGGTTADRAYTILCRGGPFASVGPGLFARVLRAIGAPEARLIESSADGALLLGEVGERLVEHHDFYAVFQTPEEYRVVCHGRELGTLPIVANLLPDASVIFSGRRWRVLEVHDERATIVVAPSNMGAPPLFGGEAGELHDAIVAEMRQVYESDDVPPFLHQTAIEPLAQARHAYRELGLSRNAVIEKDGDTFLFPWAGTATAATFVLALKAADLTASLRHIIIEVERTRAEKVQAVISRLAVGHPPVAPQLAAGLGNLRRHKYDCFLPRELLIAGLASDRLAPEAVSILARQMLASSVAS